MEAQWIEKLVIGNLVVVNGGALTTQRIERVAKITPTQIVLASKERFRRKDGQRMGDAGDWHTCWIYEATPERLREVRVASARARVRHIDWSKLPDDFVIEVCQRAKDLLPK
jgi:hypothetical protein